MLFTDLQSQDVAIGFTAYATTNREYVRQDTVRFDRISSNLGNHYNAGTSKFTCPVNGLYVFSVSVLSGNGKNMFAEIMKEERSYAMAWGDKQDNYESGSVLAVITCSSGENVWIRCNFNGHRMYGESSYGYSTFSGFLLSAL